LLRSSQGGNLLTIKHFGERALHTDGAVLSPPMAS
jgi:hypothetical protein